MVATLQTSEGLHVGTAAIPPFQTPPDVIVWGVRVFRRDRTTSDTYRECFAYAIPHDAMVQQ